MIWPPGWYMGPAGYFWWPGSILLPPVPRNHPIEKRKETEMAPKKSSKNKSQRRRGTLRSTDDIIEF